MILIPIITFWIVGLAKLFQMKDFLLTKGEITK